MEHTFIDYENELIEMRTAIAALEQVAMALYDSQRNRLSIHDLLEAVRDWHGQDEVLAYRLEDGRPYLKVGYLNEQSP